MFKVRFNPTFLAVAILAFAAAPTLHAQATRTWVSGVGDDANPCSRTAPCKTFAGAISKTASPGEIDVLDPGGFGAVTITKSITIDGGTGSGFGSILNSGVQAVVINALSTDKVTLRNISMNGAGTTLGTNGVKIIQAGKVSIENCSIFGNSGIGVSDTRSTGSLVITNTVIRNNGGNAIDVRPAGTSTIVNGVFDHLQLTGNGGGLFSNNCFGTISNSVISANSGIGIDSETGNSAISVESCVISDNGTGMTIVSASSTIRVSNSSITGNATGIALGPGSIFSFGNNKVSGNAAGNGPFTLPNISQQ